MSIHSNNINPIITRDNYEEFFLMYVDNELTPQERNQVEAFVLTNPGLQAELDMLMGAKLEPEELSFGNLDSLLSANMAGSLVDEDLLLHVDGELDEAAKDKVEQRLKKDEAYNQQFQWLLRTKSNPAEVIPCPDKESLYRHTVRRIGFAPALRVAAAVLIIASMGLVWWMQDDEQLTTAPAVANTNVRATKLPTTTTEPGTEMAKGAEQETEPATPGNKVIEANPAQDMQLAQAAAPAKAKAVPGVAKKAALQQVIIPEPTANDHIIAYNEPMAQPMRSNNLPVPVQDAPKKDAAAAVTSPNVETYNTTNTVAQPSYASANDSEDRGNNKNNLKSLLRKATRLVERRTGIDATNEEDELIIGAVAIKLK
ncbi:anti-sigma factor family protein [Pseudocnuella soli]|uniref:anti-sigma factor family protein n=1 Tax=Pseudocnuella soli TaxID=2502779 RepID=UPI00104D58BF|nr:hypothetical protein [Pseudocnuella soli]